MSEQSGSVASREERIAQLRAELDELEAQQSEVVEEALDDAVEEVQEAAEEAAEEVAEVIEEATGEPVTEEGQEVIAAVVADQVVEELAPELNPLPPVENEEVAEIVVDDEPVAPDVPPVRSHWSERKLWGR
jgi:ElaB/YqjD/DUF883 family membrane-anchored ribosome-binding protein